MSETLIGVIGISGDDYLRKPTSIGLVSPNHDVKYVDANGKEVPVNTTGELAIRGPQVLKEYYKKDEANKKSYIKIGNTGRWFLTGDVGKVDEEGFHYIVDRAKDMIIVSVGTKRRKWRRVVVRITLTESLTQLVLLSLNSSPSALFNVISVVERTCESKLGWLKRELGIDSNRLSPFPFLTQLLH